MTVDDAVVHAIFEREFPDWTLDAWRKADEGTDFVAILDWRHPVESAKLPIDSARRRTGRHESC